VETGDRRPLKLHWFVCSEQQKESAPHEKLGRGRSRRRHKGELGKSCAMLEDPRSQTTLTARIGHVAGGQGRMRMLKKNAWTGGARDCRRGDGVQLARQRQRMHVNIAKHLQLETRHASSGRVRVGLRVQRSECKGQSAKFRECRPECSRAVDLETAAQRFRKHEGQSTAEDKPNGNAACVTSKPRAHCSRRYRDDGQRGPERATGSREGHRVPERDESQ
jgi:hypothetical protein